MPRKSRLLEQTELTVHQKRFALQVAILNNVAAAARMCSISERTARRWYDLPLVREYIQELHDQAFGAAMQLLEVLTLSAVSMLNEAMNSEHTENAHKLRAAQIILDRGIEAHKIKLLETRLAELEHRLKMYDIVVKGEVVE
jgi:phage terminase small subunit